VTDPARAHRLAKRILHIVASAIEREIKDPGLAYITITDARVTGDLHDATGSLSPPSALRLGAP